MNCDTCDESKGYHLIKGTKNCDDSSVIYDSNNCPEDKPISKDGTCVLTYCTKEEYERKICNVSNTVIKTQWLDDFPYVSEIDKPLYSTLGQFSNDEVILESNLGNPFTNRKIFSLTENGRGYIDGIPGQIIDMKSSYYSTYGEGAIVYVNGHKCYLRLSYHETIEMYDFDEEKYTSAKLEDVLGYKIESYKNSLLKTNEENTFIFAYVTRGNYLIMQKFKVVTNDAKDCIQLIKTSLENYKTIRKNSRRCAITNKQYIECIEMNESQMYVIRLYDRNLEFLKYYELEKNKAPSDRAFYTYHEVILLKEEITIFVYFNDISDNSAKPLIILKNLITKNGEVELVDLSEFISKEKIYNSLPYFISDSENALAIINEYYFALASITSYENKHLLITIFNILNDGNTMYTNYFDVPIKDLYDISYYANLKAFGYKNGLGIQFDHKKGLEYRSGFIIFGYGNTTDPTPVKNLFTNYESYIIKPYDYIKIENNVFCYVLVNIIITDLPDLSTGIKVLKASNSRQLVVGDVLNIYDEIKITYKGNKDDIPRGKYIVGFKPYINEPSQEEYYECTTDLEIFGELVPTVWRPDEYYGRTAHFEFTAGECFKNCKTCKTKGNSINDQKCELCLEDFYKVKDTNNCFDEAPEGYYFNEEEEIYSPCYETCKTCSKYKYKNIHNCLSCKNNYLLYRNTNCLNCKYLGKYVNYEHTECIDTVPDGYYVNDTENNTIDECHPNCKTCSKEPEGDNMNCLTCDNDKGFYMVQNTNNCEEDPYPHHYLDGDELIECPISCESCSEKPKLDENGEVTNCDTCNKLYGFYPAEKSKVCRNYTKEGECFDDDNDRYVSCHEDCLSCSCGLEVDDEHMNCLSCDTSKGYKYFPHTKNCLNCKSKGKYVNYEQTKCIDEVPGGFYLNDTEDNTIDKCYKDCLICEKGGTEKEMNCKVCIPGLYLKNKNCVKTYTCPYKFFYQIKIDPFADINQKICLDENEECPCALPFYYTHTNECVESCPIELLLYQGCKISNIPFGLNKIIAIIKLYFSQGMIDEFTKSFSLSNINYYYNYYYSLVAKINIYALFSSFSLFRQLEENGNNAYQSLIDDNLVQLNGTDTLGDSDIDLGPCEGKLRKYYNIPEEDKLYIIKVDFKKNDSTINNVQYEVFNSKNRTQLLDLSICKDEKVIIKNSLDKSFANKVNFVVGSSSTFSESSGFYDDKCYRFSSPEGADVLLQDRLNDYNYKDQICQTGCEFKSFNSNTNEVYCLCEPNKGFPNISVSNVDELLDGNNDMLASYIKSEKPVKNQEYSGVNADYLKCTKNISIDFLKNYILILYTLLLIGYIAVCTIFILFKNKYIKKLSLKNETEQINEKPKASPPKPHKKVDLQVIGNSKTSSKSEFKKSIHKDPYAKPDTDLLEFEKSKEDERKFLQIFISSIKNREIVLFAFKEDKNISILKISLLIFALINYFGTNTFFFTEKNIHQIYLDKGNYNFGYQFKYIFAATILSFIFLSLAKFLITVHSNNPHHEISLMKIKFWILLCSSGIIFVFYWIYIGSITSTFVNAKTHLIINIILTFILTSILDCLLALISAGLRYFSIRKGNKKLYSISKIIYLL